MYLEGTQLGPTSNQGNFSFKLEVIWDTSWTYSRTIIWKLLFSRITSKWPWMIVMEPVDNMSLPEDRWLHESSRSCPVCFSATTSVCIYISIGSSHVEIPLRTGRRYTGVGVEVAVGSPPHITMNKLRPRDVKQLLQVHTAEQDWNIALLTSGPSG